MGQAEQEERTQCLLKELKQEADRLTDELQESRTKSLMLRRECTAAKQMAAESSLSEASTTFQLKSEL